tara:strand:+ start:2327 stop:2989 length:663 start_codon:yes stop_codon:yes gene_type:complete
MFINRTSNFTKYFLIIIFIIINHSFGSGGFDHGTSTGKGKIQIDLTWNPFNYFKYGQNYIVANYGITDKFDLHSYYANHPNFLDGTNSYYIGLYYQFVDSKLIDLATAIGKRKMEYLNYSHIFFPQLLYNIKLKNSYTLGGSFVNVSNINRFGIRKSENNWHTFDLALFIPINNISFIKRIEYIEDIKIGVGVFSDNQNKDYRELYPTYSIDIKFKKIIN